MKAIKSYLLFSILLVLFVASCSKSLHNKIIGEWKGTDHTGATASFVFYADGNAKMIQGNLVIDGQPQGRTVTWELNDTQSPMHLDLIVTLKDGKSKKLPMIVRFITDNKIQLRMSADMTSRPTEFLDSDQINQIILLKQQ